MPTQWDQYEAVDEPKTDTNWDRFEAVPDLSGVKLSAYEKPIAEQGVRPPSGMEPGTELTKAVAESAAPMAEKGREVANKAFDVFTGGPVLRTVGSELGGMAVDFLNRSGLDPAAQLGKPIVPLPKSELPTTDWRRGVSDLLTGTVEGLETPENAVLMAVLPEGSIGKAAAILFGSQQVAALPEQARNAIGVLNDPDATPAQKVEAVGQPVVGSLLAGVMMKHGLKGEVPPTSKNVPRGEPIEATAAPEAAPTPAAPEKPAVAPVAPQGDAAELESLKAMETRTPEQQARMDALLAKDKAAKNQEAWQAQFKAQMAAKQKATAETMIPALRTKEGQIIPGEKGKTHKDIYDAAKAKDTVAGLELQTAQPEHGFLVGDKFLTRAEAAMAVGESGDLHSQRLRELQKSPEPPKPAAPAPVEPAPAKPAETPAPAAAVPAAAAKVQRQVKKVAATEGPLKASAVKSELVKRIEDEIDKAIGESNVTLEQDAENPNQYVMRGPNNARYAEVETTKSGRFSVTSGKVGYGAKGTVKATFDTMEEAKWFMKGLVAEGEGNATVEIPGDGSFKIVRRGENLVDLWKKARGLDVESGGTPDVIPTGTKGKVDPDEIAASARKLYGDNKKAIAGIERQLASDQEMEPGQRELLERAAQLIREDTIEFKRQQRIDELAQEIKDDENAIKFANERLAKVKGEMKSESGTAKQRKFIYEQERTIQEATRALPAKRAEHDRLFEAAQAESKPTPAAPEAKGPGTGEGAMPPNQSLGGALAGEDLGSGGDYASNMFAAIDRDRQAMGKPPMAETRPRTWDEDNQRALAQMNRDPQWIPNLLDQMEKRPRPLLSWENAGVVWHRAKLKAEYNNALQRIARAFDDGREEALTAAKTEAAAFEDGLERLDRIVGRNGTGSEAGRSLNAQKMGAGDDFTLVEMTLQKRAALGGRRLTPEETASIKKDVDRLNQVNSALQKNLAEAEGKTSELNAKLALEAIEKESLRKQIPAFDKRILAAAEKIVTGLKTQAQSARDRIAARRAQPGAMSGPLDPADIDDYAIIASSHIAEKGLNAAKALDAMVREFGEAIKPEWDKIWAKANTLLDNLKVPDPVKRAVRKGATDSEKQADITERIEAKLKDKRLDEITPLVQKLALQFSDQGVRGWRGIGDAVHGVLKELIPDLDYRDTLDAISGHGKFRIPNQAEGARALRDAKSQMQEVRKIQEVIARQPVQPTGLKRDLPSDIKRRLTQIYENAKRRFGVVVSDPATQLRSALQARKTYYEHRISDLQSEINSRKRTVKAKAASPTDPALEKLIEEYKKVKAQHDETFPPQELTDAQKADREVKSLDRQIAEVERQLKQGDIFPEGHRARPNSPAIEARRANLEALKAERDYLRDAINPKTTPEQQQLQAVEKRRDQLQKSLEEAERRINTGDISTKTGGPKPESTPELQAMRDELGQMNKMLSEMRRAARPPMTDAQRLSALKASLTRNNAKLADKLARGDFSKIPRREIVMDTEATRLRVESERIKKRWRQELLADRMKNRTPWEKLLDWGTKFRRFTALSSPAVLPKLFGAAGWRAVSTAAEDVAGRGLSLIPGISRISDKAPIEGAGGQLKATMRGYGKAFTKGLVDAADVIKTGRSDLDVLHGKAGESYTGEYEMASALLSFPGRLHGMIKAPVKRGAFEKATQRLGEYYARQGLDPADPVVATRIAVDAYKAGNRAIFLQDNRVASAFNSALAALERKGETGHPSPGGKVLATAARFMFPVTRVPVNIAAETLQYATGSVTGSARAVNAIRKGLDTLTPNQADLIMRELKKGSVGMAALALGYMGYQSIGGVYEQGKKRKAGDLKPGTIQMFGETIPENLLHAPVLNTIQLGATIHRTAEEKLRKKDESTQGLSAGLLAAGWGLADEVPFIQGPHRLFGGLADPYTRQRTIGNEVGSIAIPQAIAWTAQVFDERRETPPTGVYNRITGAPARLNPQGILQTLETRIPGLRQRVPAKGQTISAPAAPSPIDDMFKIKAPGE